MAHFPDYMDSTEARICNKLLTAIFARGLLVRVFDGEEYATGYTRDRAEIQRATAATGVTVYRLARPVTEDDADMLRKSGKPGAKWVYMGSVVLVHGNGEDVVSDFSAPTGAGLDFVENIIAEAVR